MEVDRNDNDDDDDDDDASDDIAARRGGASGSRAPAKKATKTTTAAAKKAASTTAKKAPATKRGAKKAAVPLVSRLEATNTLPKSSANLILDPPPPRLLPVRRWVRRRRRRRGRSGRFRGSRVCFPTYGEEACSANDAGYERKEGAGRFDFESRGGETESIVVCLESRVAARVYGRRISMGADHFGFILFCQFWCEW